MNKIAIFTDGKLSMLLDEEETKIFNLLAEDIKHGSLSTKYKKDTTPIGIGINTGSSKIKIKKVKDDIVCNIDIKIDATLEEINGFSGKPEELIPLFSSTLKRKTVMLLDKLKEGKADPLDLQMRYWAGNPNYTPSEEWLTELYPQIRFEVNPDIKLSQTGLLRAQ